MSDLGHLLGWRPAIHFPASRRQLSLLAAATLSTLLLLLTWHNQEGVRRAVSATFHSSAGSAGPLCRQLPGADDVLVVMKTGANEVEDKLAVHLQTTLTCYPNHVIFSDFEEDLPTGQHLFDAFKYTSTRLKETHRDFALWRKLQVEGRAGLLPTELSGTDSREKSEDIRKKIPGWQLDKWKFLPMVNQTLHLYPDKHWYVFVEADTYLLWSNLLPYLAERSWTDDHYIGSRAVIEELGFAHGGSGFLLSRSALVKVVALFNDNQEKYEEINGRYWVGDHILAVALRDAGVLLQNGVPSWQGDPIGLLNLSPNNGFWCSTAMTFHHELPTEIADLWQFEQALILERAKSNETAWTELLRHQDLLRRYVLPRVHHPLAAWDNKAEHSHDSPVTSLSQCEALCKEDVNCMQYAFHHDGKCKTTSKVVYGDPSEGVESGWMVHRISEVLDKSHAC